LAGFFRLPAFFRPETGARRDPVVVRLPPDFRREAAAARRFDPDLDFAGAFFLAMRSLLAGS